jgi:hypothetical protein
MCRWAVWTLCDTRGCQPDELAFAKDASVDRSTVICFSFGWLVRPTFLQLRDQIDVGISKALPLALASSILSVLLLLTRLAVMSARNQSERGWQLFHVPQ